MIALLIVGVALSGVDTSPFAHPPAQRTVCSTVPEIQGLDSASLSRGLRGLSSAAGSLHSLLIARNGCLVVEGYRAPYDRDATHYLNSATKAVLSAVVGIAVHDGRLREDAGVLSYLPTYAAANDDPRRAAITIRDLLTM